MVLHIISKSFHNSLILKSLHWLKITKCIEYNCSHIYKVLTATHSTCICTSQSLWNHFAVYSLHLLSPCLTKNVLLFWSHSLQYISRSPSFWNQFISSVLFYLLFSESPLFAPVNSSSSLSPSICPPFIHSTLKTYLCTNPSHHGLLVPTGLQ